MQSLFRKINAIFLTSNYNVEKKKNTYKRNWLLKCLFRISFRSLQILHFLLLACLQVANLNRNNHKPRRFIRYYVVTFRIMKWNLLTETDKNTWNNLTYIHICYLTSIIMQYLLFTATTIFKLRRFKASLKKYDLIQVNVVN